jgi:hypothetical protein
MNCDAKLTTERTLVYCGWKWGYNQADYNINKRDNSTSLGTLP